MTMGNSHDLVMALNQGWRERSCQCETGKSLGVNCWCGEDQKLWAWPPNSSHKKHGNKPVVPCGFKKMECSCATNQVILGKYDLGKIILNHSTCWAVKTIRTL